MKQHYDLDTPVFKIPDGDGCVPWTIRHAVNGLQIWGGIGSGKTSGSGRLVALKYLSLGFGGLVLTAKKSEKDLFIEYCKMTGRLDDLIIVEPGQKNFFNMLAYESADRGGHIPFTENILQILKTVLQASAEKSGSRHDDPFWETALDMVLFYLIELCQLAYGSVTVQNLHAIAQSMPRKAATPQDANKNASKENATGKEEKRTAYDLAFITAAEKINKLTRDFLNASEGRPRPTDQAMEDAIPEIRRMKQVDNFFFEILNMLSDKTRGVIDLMLTGFLLGLLREPIYSLFARHASTFTPEDCYTKGKIILINLPVKEYDKVGRDCQIMFKYIWQRAMERRNIDENERPVFLWADEAHLFLHRHDSEYQATARGSRIATVYISQNLHSYYASMSGDKSEYRVKGFTGTLSTHIFHANADIEMNRFASDMIGEAYQMEETEAISAANGTTTITKTVSTALRKMVRPEAFSGELLTGGPTNNHTVSAYISVQGAKFSNGFNYKKILFNQQARP